MTIFACRKLDNVRNSEHAEGEVQELWSNPEPNWNRELKGGIGQVWGEIS